MFRLAILFVILAVLCALYGGATDGASALTTMSWAGIWCIVFVCLALWAFLDGAFTLWSRDNF